MSRERPSAPPPALPDAERGVNHSIAARHERQRADLERVKAFHGPAFLAGFFSATAKHLPKFIRRGYESNIVDELRDFYTWKPWRPKANRPGMTRKERLKILRRMEQAGQIRRCGGGRFERVKVAPHG